MYMVYSSSPGSWLYFMAFEVKYKASFGPKRRNTDRKRSHSITFNTNN